MQDPARPVSPVQNVAGGVDNAMSLAQLSRWCADRTRPPLRRSRNFNPALSISRGWSWIAPAPLADWDWRPTTPLPAILHEIKEHATSHPVWLDMIS